MPRTPVDLGFLAGVEPVDVGECSVTTAESFPQDGFVGEGAFETGDVVECEEGLGSWGGGVAAEESNGVFFVGDQGADDGDALGSGSADDEDIGGGVGRRCWRVLRLRCNGRLLGYV
jgi:hypothetical protein